MRQAGFLSANSGLKNLNDEDQEYIQLLETHKLEKE